MSVIIFSVVVFCLGLLGMAYGKWGKSDASFSFYVLSPNVVAFGLILFIVSAIWVGGGAILKFIF